MRNQEDQKVMVEKIQKMVVQEIQELEGWELKRDIEFIAHNHLDRPLEVYHEEIQTYVDEMNRRVKLIAKKYNRKPVLFKVKDFSKRWFEAK